MDTTTLPRMTVLQDRITKSGVRVAGDFRDNLIIDRYDPVFVNMRASKLKHLRSENSEDAITWNVFRSLRQVDPAVWLPELCRRGLPTMPLLPACRCTVSLWVAVNPPTGLLEDGDEGVSEIDVVIEAPSFTWFIEAKYRSDISTGTRTRPWRDQVLRNIDVGSCYAGVRQFFFSLLVDSKERSPLGDARVNKYRNFDEPRDLLKGHRSDGLQNLKAVTLLTWADLGAVLTTAVHGVHRADEFGYADRALTWMRQRGLIHQVS
jgi:hypothetical protein